MLRRRLRLWLWSTTGDPRNRGWQRRRLWTRPPTGAIGVSRNMCTRTPLASTVRARRVAKPPVVAPANNRRRQRYVHDDTFSDQSKCAVGQALRKWLPSGALRWPRWHGWLPWPRLAPSAARPPSREPRRFRWPSARRVGPVRHAAPPLRTLSTLGREPRGAVREDPALQGRDLAGQVGAKPKWFDQFHKTRS